MILCRALPFSRLPSYLPDVIHMILPPRPSTCFCILQVIKKWRREWLGNKVTLQLHCYAKTGEEPGNEAKLMGSVISGLSHCMREATLVAQ